jgi:antiviral helicase SKI2
MLYRGADLIRDIEWVIFDEVHYVNDAEVCGTTRASNNYTVCRLFRYSEVFWVEKRLGHFRSRFLNVISVI